MFSKTRIFTNPASISSAPSLYSPAWYLKEIPENAKLKELYYDSIPDTKVYREISFWNEPVVISFAYITAYTVLGDGIKVLSGNENVKMAIQEFNDQINIGRQSIDDLFCDSYIDNIIHAQAFWRLMDTDEVPSGLDLARLDPVTLTKKKSKVKGYELLVQAAKKENKEFYSANAYYNYWKDQAYQATSLGDIVEDDYWDAQEDSKYDYVIVPNEPKTILEFEFFRRPPISPILNHMSFKRQILKFMKNYAERQWTGFKLGKVGNPQFMMPDTEEEFKKERDNLLQALVQMKNFGAMVTPGYNSVEEFGQNSAKSGEIFIDSMNFLNEEMMFSMMGSMGIRTARGTELATSRVLEQGFLRGAKGIQGRYDRNLKTMYKLRLLPKKGISSTDAKDFTLKHSPMIIEKISDVVKAVTDACDKLLFDDWNEPRQILQTVFGAVMDELPDSRAKELMEKFIEMNKSAPPKLPGQGSPKPSPAE